MLIIYRIITEYTHARYCTASNSACPYSSVPAIFELLLLRYITHYVFLTEALEELREN